MHVDSFLERCNVEVHFADVEEGFYIAATQYGDEPFAQTRKVRDLSPHLTDADQAVCDITIQALWKITILSDNRVDQVGLECDTLEEHVTVGGISVRI